MRRLKIGIIGSGNIGCDLLMKIERSPLLECTLFMGRNLDSHGMQFAYRRGVSVSADSIDALKRNPEVCDLVFDATTASAHLKNAPILRDLHIKAVDLTPSLVGEMCVPIVNGEDCLSFDNVNMITCGGQAIVPVAHAIASVVKNISYVELVASISSDSAGPGTRANIDEFTQTTRKALVKFTGAEKAKAIIILNPAKPPILMHNTLYVSVADPDIDIVRRSVRDVENRIRDYLPGYRVVQDPTYYDGKIVVMVQIEGSGDYLPRYSGNLDVITAAAVRYAEMYAERRLGS